MDLTNASAIVTGGAGGFGSATVRAGSPRRGAKVVIADVSNERGEAYEHAKIRNASRRARPPDLPRGFRHSWPRVPDSMAIGDYPRLSAPSASLTRRLELPANQVLLARNVGAELVHRTQEVGGR
jgi:NAD(P)-dependent dehydrogenase (short-subunit alcohol dehydrogenase family)